MLVEVHQLSTQHNLVEVQVRSTQPSLEKDALVRQMGMSPAGPPHCSFKVKRVAFWMKFPTCWDNVPS